MNIPTQQESKQSAEKHVLPINSKQFKNRYNNPHITCITLQ